MSEMFKIPIIKLLYLGMIEISDKDFCKKLKGTYFAISPIKVNSINMANVPNAAITELFVNVETKIPIEIKENPNKKVPTKQPTTKLNCNLTKSESIIIYIKFIETAITNNNIAAKYFPKTMETLPTGQENKSLSVYSLYSSLKSPIVKIGVEKIIVKKSELKKPLTSAKPTLKTFKKNIIPDIAKNMLRKTNPTGFKK